jgi:hypothetical protein
MAYNFVSASAQRIHSTNTISRTGHPVTIAVWFQRAAQNAVMVFAAHDEISGSDRWNVLGNNSDSIRARIGINTSTFGNDSSIAGETLNAWNSAVGRFSSTTNRLIYLNDNAGSSNTASRNPSAVNNLNIGATWNSTLVQYMNGQLAEVALWNIALSADDVTALAKGFKAFRVRPQNLVYYVPLVREIQELRSALGLTNANAATVTDHPRVY